MARVTVEDCLEKIENRFTLVHMASRRARMLLEGDERLVDAPFKNKETTVSLREIAGGKVNLIEQAPARRSTKGLSRRRRRRR